MKDYKTSYGYEMEGILDLNFFTDKALRVPAESLPQIFLF